MSEPSKEHIEAVAGLIEEWLYRMHGIQSSCRHEVEAAEILCSHDPAVLDAMQDALVRAGWAEWSYDSRCDRCGVHRGFFHKGCEGQWVPIRRLVAEWEPA